jgi:hypothetical protein
LPSVPGNASFICAKFPAAYNDQVLGSTTSRGPRLDHYFPIQQKIAIAHQNESRADGQRWRQPRARSLKLSRLPLTPPPTLQRAPRRRVAGQATACSAVLSAAPAYTWPRGTNSPTARLSASEAPQSSRTRAAHMAAGARHFRGAAGPRCGVGPVSAGRQDFSQCRHNPPQMALNVVAQSSEHPTAIFNDAWPAGKDLIRSAPSNWSEAFPCLVASAEWQRAPRRRLRALPPPLA